MVGRQGIIRFGWAVLIADRPTTRRRRLRETTIAMITGRLTARRLTIARITQRRVAPKLTTAMIIEQIVPRPTAPTQIIEQIVPRLTAPIRRTERIIRDRGALRITVLLSTRRLTTGPIIPGLALQLPSVHHRRHSQHRLRTRLQNMQRLSTKLMKAAAPSPPAMNTMRSRPTNTSPLYLCREPNLLS